MQLPLVIANWKMTGRPEGWVDFIHTFTRLFPAPAQAVLVVCPPFPALGLMAPLLKNYPHLALGGQDVSDMPDGAFTGEISATMLRDLRARYCIVGHSERRKRFAETDAQVFAKADALQSAEINPIICVGETLEEKNKGDTLKVLEKQLLPMKKLNFKFTPPVIAYEPVWAISGGGAKKPASAEEIAPVVEFIAKFFEPQVNGGQPVKIVYGGSVAPAACGWLKHVANLKGVLVGSASTDPDSLSRITKTLLE